MPLVIRLGDVDTLHANGPTSKAATNTSAKGAKICRLTDTVECLIPAAPLVHLHPLPGTITGSSTTVSVEGLLAARVGDATTHPCGPGVLDTLNNDSVSFG